MADNQPILIKVSNSRQIPLKPEMLIGRQAECDLLLTEGHASRRHARLQLTADGVWLEDLGSANGTYINGTRITQKMRLKSGDRLRFDLEEFDFRMPTPAVEDGKTIFRPAPVRQPEIGRTEIHRPGEARAPAMVRPAEARPPEPVRHEPTRPAEGPRYEATRPAEVPRHEPTRQAEVPRHEPTRQAEAPRHEPTRQAEAPRREPTRVAEAVRPEPPRAPEVRPEAPRAAPEPTRPEPVARAEPAKPPESRPEPAKPAEVVAVASSGAYKRPGAWADPDSMGEGGNKTKFIDPEQMKQMMKAQPASAVQAAAIDGPHLQVVSGARAGLNIKLTVGESGNKEWTIGSQPEREVQFNDSGVSALHAKIVNEGARWKVIDQMSANGTFVNGKRSNVSYLSAGDRVRFGPVECVFNVRPSSGGGSYVSGAASEKSPTNNKTLMIGVAAFVGTIIVLFLLYKFLM